MLSSGWTVFIIAIFDLICVFFSPDNHLILYDLFSQVSPPCNAGKSNVPITEAIVQQFSQNVCKDAVAKPSMSHGDESRACVQTPQSGWSFCNFSEFDDYSLVISNSSNVKHSSFQRSSGLIGTSTPCSKEVAAVDTGCYGNTADFRTSNISVIVTEEDSFLVRHGNADDLFPYSASVSRRGRNTFSPALHKYQTVVQNELSVTGQQQSACDVFYDSDGLDVNLELPVTCSSSHTVLRSLSRRTKTCAVIGLEDDVVVSSFHSDGCTMSTKIDERIARQCMVRIQKLNDSLLKVLNMSGQNRQLDNASCSLFDSSLDAFGHLTHNIDDRKEAVTNLSSLKDKMHIFPTGEMIQQINYNDRHASFHSCSPGSVSSDSVHSSSSNSLCAISEAEEGNVSESMENSGPSQYTDIADSCGVDVAHCGHVNGKETCADGAMNSVSFCGSPVCLSELLDDVPLSDNDDNGDISMLCVSRKSLTTSCSFSFAVSLSLALMCLWVFHCISSHVTFVSNSILYAIKLTCLFCHEHQHRCMDVCLIGLSFT